jgi:hypothetical protein
MASSGRTQAHRDMLSRVTELTVRIRWVGLLRLLPYTTVAFSVRQLLYRDTQSSNMRKSFITIDVKGSRPPPPITLRRIGVDCTCGGSGGNTRIASLLFTICTFEAPFAAAAPSWFTRAFLLGAEAAEAEVTLRLDAARPIPLMVVESSRGKGGGKFLHTLTHSVTHETH